MLNHPTPFDIFDDRPAENAEIWSWIYIKTVSEDQCPFLQMVSHGMLFRCMAMALPAHSEWLLMDDSGNPFLSSLVVVMATFRMWLLSDACRHHSPLAGCV